MTRITGALYEDKYTLLIISRSVLLRMRDVSKESCRKIKRMLYESQKKVVGKSKESCRKIKRKF
jgi:hypothetical protein